MMLGDMFYSMVANKCSRCHKGDVFVNSNPYQLGTMFKMHESCSHCHLTYEREPGFFYGAMYVSYAMSAGWFIVWFALQKLLLNLDWGLFVGLFIGFIVLISPLTLRWSRILWLNFFFQFRKEMNGQTAQENILTNLQTEE